MACLNRFPALAESRITSWFLVWYLSLVYPQCGVQMVVISITQAVVWLYVTWKSCIPKVLPTCKTEAAS